MSIIQDNTKDYPLEIAEKTFEELYSKADILYFLLDAQAHILSSNITAEEKLDYTKKDLIGKKILSFIPEKQASATEQALHACYHRGYIKDFETRIRSKHNIGIPIRLNGLAQSDSQGNVEYVRLYAQDISEWIRSEKEKEFLLKILVKIQSGKETDRKIKEILNDVQQYTESEGVGFFMRKPNHTPLNWVTWNDADVSSPDENDFRKWSSEFWQQIIQATQGAEVARFTPNGSFWTESLSDLIIEVSGMEEKDALVSLSNFESLGVIRIPEAQNQNSVLVLTHREKNRWNERDILFLETVAAIFGYLKQTTAAPSRVPTSPAIPLLMEVPFIGILVVRNEKIDRVNTWIEDWTGYTQQELQEKNVYELLAPECIAPFREWLSGIGDLGSGEFEKELIVLSKDNNRRASYASISRIVENGNPFELWYWTPKPEQAELHEQWMHIKRMEYLGMLSGSLVLDFNNLLSCILGYTSLLSEEIAKDSPYFEDVQQISKTAEKATELTSRLLASAQGTPYVMDDLDVNMLVKEVAAYLSKTMKKNIVIRAELDPKLEKIHADANQVQQTILQIALNARDAMPNGGKLFFQTRNYKVTEADTHLHAGSRPGHYIQIAVSDTGLGMSGEIKDRLLKQMVSKTISTTAIGLGLAMVRQIVESHGGFISVFSEAGKGTLFKVHFPIEEKKKSASVLKGGKPALGKETILLVDDEFSLRETARKMLTRYGYKVIAADNGTEAVAIYKKHIDRIHLIILDLFMPGMEIHKVLTWFKKLNPNVRILASAGMDEKNEIGETFHSNVVGFVQKPFQLRPLLESIRNVLNA